MFSAPVPRQAYTGNGVTTVFAVPFEFRESTDLLVLLKDTTTEEVTELILDTDYTVSGGDSESGFVTMDVAPSADEELTIIDNPAAIQEAEIEEGAEFPSEDVEISLDRTAMVARRAKDLASRSLHASDADPADVDLELPPADERASSFLAFDADGDPIASDGGIDAAIPVSTFMATVLDDVSATAARTTLDAQQKTTSLVALTTPATDDVMGIVDTSASSADKKITVADLLAIVNVLTKHTTPIPADILPIYDSTAGAVKGIYMPGVFAGAKRAGQFSNIGFTAATNVLTIGGATASQSASNPAYLNLPDTSSFGRVSTFLKTADVTLTMGAAHWGFDGLGDVSNAEIWVIAINDGSGTLKYGLTVQGGLTSVASTDTTATAASVTTVSKILVDSALAVGTWPVIYLGYFLANRVDGTNTWTILTTVGSLNVGGRINDSTLPAAYTPVTQGFGTMSSVGVFWQRRGNCVRVWGDATCGTVTADEAQFGLPNSLKTSNQAGAGTNNFPGFLWKSTASATTVKRLPIILANVIGYVGLGMDDYTTANSPFSFRTGSAVLANSMTVALNFEVPVWGWSSNGN